MHRQIALTRGRFALVDVGDFDTLSRHSWHFSSNGFAASSIKKQDDKKYKSFLMHRLIMNAKDGVYVDHINGDRLDNRRANLRFATAKENARNHKPKGKSGLNGVRPGPRSYAASIAPNGIEIALGVYETPEVAAAAYNAAARIVYGEFARLNDVPDVPGLLEAILETKAKAIQRIKAEIDALTGVVNAV